MEGKLHLIKTVGYERGPKEVQICATYFTDGPQDSTEEVVSSTGTQLQVTDGPPRVLRSLETPRRPTTKILTSSGTLLPALLPMKAGVRPCSGEAFGRDNGASRVSRAYNNV